jgi:DNA gyrase subunit A
MAYSRPRSGGLIGVKLATGDELIAARITDGNMNVFLGSDGGKVIRFHESDVRATARGSMGVRGMRIPQDSQVVGMEVLAGQQTLLTVTENGYGKRTAVAEYKTQNRGGMGVFSIKTSKRNGKMVSLALVDDTDELMMVTDKGILIRTDIGGINIISRNTQGVKLINLGAGEKLIGIARLFDENGDTDDLDSEIQADDGDSLQ